LVLASAAGERLIFSGLIYSSACRLRGSNIRPRISRSLVDAFASSHSSSSPRGGSGSDSGSDSGGIIDERGWQIRGRDVARMYRDFPILYTAAPTNRLRPSLRLFRITTSSDRDRYGSGFKLVSRSRVNSGVGTAIHARFSHAMHNRYASMREYARTDKDRFSKVWTIRPVSC